MKEKVILVDCDGVLVDWEYAFDCWMDFNGYRKTNENGYLATIKYGIAYEQAENRIKMFNQSAAIGFLPPLRDSIYYIKKLHEQHGYIFHMISSLGKEPHAQKLRVQNTEMLFGKTAFEKYIFLDTNEEKSKPLSLYANTECYWIEDKPENAIEGLKQGLNSILINHHYNTSFSGDKMVKRANDWKEIYNIITA